MRGMQQLELPSAHPQLGASVPSREHVRKGWLPKHIGNVDEMSESAAESADDA